MTNQNGQPVRTHAIGPFGIGDGTQVGTETLRFTGKERDAETELDYFGARYYSSHTGRFGSVDPALGIEAAMLDPQRWNRYAYALNRPLAVVDPDGRHPMVIGGAVGAVVFGGWKAFLNVRQGRSWYENVGLEAAKGLVVGATFGLAAPAIAGGEAAMGGTTIAAGASSAGAAANVLGNVRQNYVSQLIGGRLAGDFKVVLPNVGSTGIDVFGRAASSSVSAALRKDSTWRTSGENYR